eukprot:CAMPEP_0115007534 /NCGR_PEP_ID=MMETSP0216-20121206/21259_1 /TAXON_ID=223996 /ORGANISM="Protocruzia adherens, Strain Boccale" /LENGTH=828 /DNA_ID=CAMNT_0002374539 /DNA_START=267 /DNA_END=2749 /DNA_ORIENTATION=+
MSTKFIKGSNNTTVSEQDYINFWEKVTDETSLFATQYLTDLIGKMISLESNYRYAKGDLTYERLLSTLYFCALYCPIQKGGLLTKWIEKYEKHRRNVKIKSKVPDMIIECIKKLYVKDQQILEQLTIQTLIPKVFAIYTPDDVTKNNLVASKTHILNPDFAFEEHGEYSFLYVFVMKCFNTKKRIEPEVLNGLEKQLVSIEKKFEIVANPKMPETYLLCIVFFVKQIISLYPLRQRESLYNLMENLEPFRSWPLPHGIYVHEMMDYLHNEIKCYGFSLLNRLLSRFPVLQFTEQDRFTGTFKFPSRIEDEDEVRSRSASLNSFDQNSAIDVIQNTQTTFVFINSEEDNESTYIHEFRAANGMGIGITQQKFIKLKLLLLFYSQYYELSYDVVHQMLVLPRGEIANRFQAFLKARAEVQIKDYTDQYDTLSQFVKAQIEEIAQLKPEEGLKQVTTEEIEDPLFDLEAEQEEITNGVYTPDFPLIRFTVIDISEILAAYSNSEKTSTLYYRPKKVYKYMLDIFTALSKNLVPLMPRVELKLVVYGDNSHLYEIFSAFALLRMEYINLFEKIQPSFYIVPSNYNTLAQWMASKDQWYLKHIYVPFYEKPILPRLDPLSVSLKMPQGGQKFGDTRILPVDMLDELFQSYLRDAENLERLFIFEVECYAYTTEDSANLTPDIILPFAQYLDIGLNEEYMSFLKSNSLPLNTPKLDVIGDPYFKFASHDLTVKAKATDPMGIEYVDERVFSRTFKNITLSNIPRQDEFVNHRNHYDPFLEMTYLEAASFKQEQHLIKDGFKSSQGSKVVRELANCYSNLQVKTVTITTNDKSKP